MQDLTGQHVVVTGGGSGIGLAIAQAAHRAGAAVTVMGRSAQKLEAALQTLPGAHAVAVDVSDEESVARGFEQAVLAIGPVTVLVNNAGMAKTAPFHRTSTDVWQQMLAVNLTGVFHCTQAALNGMRACGEGRIINIASTSGLKGYAYTSAYTAAKHGVVGLTRALALELADTNITVNAICPGFADTEIVSDAIENIRQKTGRSEEQALAALVQHNPQKRLIDPNEVADMVLWLCSGGARSVTGQSLVVAGGEIM